MKRAAILVRVSLEKQDYQRQIDELTELAKLQGYEVNDDDVYKEKASGVNKDADRIGLARFLDDVRNKKKDIAILYIWEVSRLSRNPKEGRELLEEMNELKIPIYVKNLHQKTLDDEGKRSSIFSIIFQVLIEFAATEAEYIKQRSMSGKRQGAKLGKYTGGSILAFGYGKNELLYLYVIDEEAEILRKMYQMCIDGMGAVQIADYLNEQNIPTRTGKVKWCMTVVWQILKNPIYFGTREYRGEMFDGVPAIVTKEVWDSAQLAIASRSNKKGNVKYLWLLKSKIVCGVCGGTYNTKFNIRKECFYACANRQKKDSTCTNAGIGIPHLDGLVWHIIKENFGLFNFLKTSTTEYETIKADIKLLKQDLKHVEAELLKKEFEKERTLNLYTKSIYNDKQLDEALIKFEKSKSTIIFKVESVKTQLISKENWQKNFNNKKSYLKNIDEIGKDRLKIAEVFQSMIDRIIINSKATGDNQNIYFLKIYLKGDALPITGEFHKKERMWYKQFDLQTEIKNLNMKQVINPKTKFINTIDLSNKGELIEKIGIDMVNYAVDKVPRVYKN